MTDNVRKIFDMLGVEPNEKFRVEGCGDSTNIFTIDENLIISDDKENISETLLTYLLIGDCKIIKLPKEPKKKKLRDLTPEEWDKWKEKYCVYFKKCTYCPFLNVLCSNRNAWVNHKDLYSDKFLDQEIEVE